MVISAVVLSALLSQCAPDVSPITMNALIQTESGRNPYVVANVTDGVSKSFDSANEATAYVNKLSLQGKTYSAGLMQIYSENFKRYGLNNVSVFSLCDNIKAGSKILIENYESQRGEDEQLNLRRSLSMFYSGNRVTGFLKEKKFKNTSYVERVEKNAYLVPSLLPSSDGNNLTHKTDDREVSKSKPNSWDVFGDY